VRRSKYKRYVIEYEDAAFQGSRCPWHRQIRCQHGFIAPAGGGKLYAYGKVRVVHQLEALPGVTILQGSKTEIGLTFHEEQFASVAAILKPVRKK
jgi:hypothetical protein